MIQLHRDMWASWSEYTLFGIWPKRSIKGTKCVDLDLQFLQLTGDPPIEGDILYVPYTKCL